ncbi:3' terminal RNA ribose 2'-O-methyltransferase Hen1 [Actibacterium sp. 188UL27-1]|uniref:3' terminal RNA ribose 2'-O-methyltransferase Hen1 n=1 Tax=Actibacterium sp. 188UL27-1 TaxID=2786961 RepID=UPI00195C0E72|nr:3' terminal RNA ribose 2'-O-methyltransferase Hen1 [Actibacterium sp. 188UL27-1]MBM7067244.1 3' terminal RNA ribose 2'-O-methyltransferase Hen1 [Actibacterium sp. 188UL27-1]
MQIELTLTAQAGADYSARDLGYLLHKHPDHVHVRDVAAGQLTIFYPEISDDSTTAVVHLNVDPVALVRGKNDHSDGLLSQYVNDRPYVASTFLSVSLTRALGQSMSGKSKERQDLADRELPYRARILPIALAGELDLARLLFEPLGYQVEIHAVDDSARVVDLVISGTTRLSALLNHLYVLIPVLDNAKHYFIDKEEIDKLLAKGEGWLATHPARDLITRRALKHRRALMNMALARLDESLATDDLDEDEPRPEPEEHLETPIRLHDLRLDAVEQVLKSHHTASVLDLGCGEGKLMRRLIKDGTFTRIVGVDPSVRTLEKANRRLYLNQASDAMAQRVTLQMGSLTYGDRRWKGFDAATLVEVIEHIEPHRLSALALSVFGDAKPGLVVMTTPNREYNALFDGMEDGQLRHPDHRFEWTRAKFQGWADAVAAQYDYTVTYAPLGPVDDTHGGPSQMATFTRGAA